MKGFDRTKFPMSHKWKQKTELCLKIPVGNMFNTVIADEVKVLWALTQFKRGCFVFNLSNTELKWCFSLYLKCYLIGPEAGVFS